MTKYTEFYFLHIPKAGGRSFKDNVILPIRRLLVQNRISLIRDSDAEYSGPSHNEWVDDITEFSYVACTFRDPARHLVSLFSHTTTTDKHGNRLVNSQQLKKKDFFLWVDANRPGLENFQSRNIASSPWTAHRIEAISQNPGIVSPLDRDLVFKRIRRMNMFLKLEDIDLSGGGLDDIRKAILGSFEIDSSQLRPISSPVESFYNQFSEDLYNLLTSSEIDELSRISPVDSEIHQTNSLFWRK